MVAHRRIPGRSEADSVWAQNAAHRFGVRGPPFSLGAPIPGMLAHVWQPAVDAGKEGEYATLKLMNDARLKAEESRYQNELLVSTPWPVQAPDRRHNYLPHAWCAAFEKEIIQDPRSNVCQANR